MFRRMREQREERRDEHQIAHYQIRQNLITISDDFWIEDERGRRVARVDGPDLEMQGNILDHEYRIAMGSLTVAEVSKGWFRLADTCGVGVVPDQNDILLLAVTVAVLAVTVAVDTMAQEGH